MEKNSIQNFLPVWELSSPQPLPRSASLNAIDFCRQTGVFGSFHSNLDTVVEPDRLSRRAPLCDKSRELCRDSSTDPRRSDTDTLVDDKKEIMESAGSSSGDANSASARRDSYIPPVPRVPSIYSRQNVGRGRGTGSGRLPPPRRPAPRPPVSYNHQRNGSVLPHPDPLRSTPTVAGFGLTASASTNDLVQPTRAASGSHFPVSDHNSPRIPSHSSRNQPRDSMFIRQPKPLHEIEQTLRPITYLPEENTNSSFSTSTSTPRTNGDSKSDHKKRSPKHQRSFLGLKKAATDSSNPSQASEPPDSIRSKGSRFQLRKTPSRIMNLDQVAKGVAPVTGDTQIAAVLSNDQLSASVENQPTAKRQRSRFQLRKTPTNIPAPKTSKQPDQAEMDHTTSIEESMLSQDKSSVLKEDPSFRRQSNNRGTSKPSPKQYRSLFNLRKTPTGVPQLSSGLSPKHHSQVSGPTMPSPRQYRPTVNPSTTNLQPTSPTRIPTPVAPALDNKSRYFSEPVKSSQKENARPHRLMGPISPSRAQAPPQKPMPKARTLGMLSNLTSTFSRSSTNLTKATRTAEPTTFVDPASASAPQPTFIPEAHLIYGEQEYMYWAGRYQGLHDRYHTEELDDTMKDPDAFQKFQDSSKSAPTTPHDAELNNFEKVDTYEPTTKGIQSMAEAEEARVVRVFSYLTRCCADDASKKSLFEWQQTYARQHQNDKYLPRGGSMTDKPPGWVSRMTTAMGRRNEKENDAPGTQTAQGRRTGLTASVFGNKRAKESRPTTTAAAAPPVKQRRPSPDRGNFF